MKNLDDLVKASLEQWTAETVRSFRKPPLFIGMFSFKPGTSPNAWHFTPAQCSRGEKVFLGNRVRQGYQTVAWIA